MAACTDYVRALLANSVEASSIIISDATKQEFQIDPRPPGVAAHRPLEQADRALARRIAAPPRPAAPQNEAGLNPAITTHVSGPRF